MASVRQSTLNTFHQLKQDTPDAWLREIMRHPELPDNVRYAVESDIAEGMTPETVLRDLLSPPKSVTVVQDAPRQYQPIGAPLNDSSGENAINALEFGALQAPLIAVSGPGGRLVKPAVEAGAKKLATSQLGKRAASYMAPKVLQALETLSPELQAIVANSLGYSIPSLGVNTFKNVVNEGPSSIPGTLVGEAVGFGLGTAIPAVGAGVQQVLKNKGVGGAMQALARGATEGGAMTGLGMATNQGWLTPVLGTMGFAGGIMNSIPRGMAYPDQMKTMTENMLVKAGMSAEEAAQISPALLNPESSLLPTWARNAGVAEKVKAALTNLKQQLSAGAADVGFNPASTGALDETLGRMQGTVEGYTQPISPGMAQRLIPALSAEENAAIENALSRVDQTTRDSIMATLKQTLPGEVSPLPARTTREIGQKVIANDANLAAVENRTVKVMNDKLRGELDKMDFEGMDLTFLQQFFDRNERILANMDLFKGTSGAEQMLNRLVEVISGKSPMSGGAILESAYRRANELVRSGQGVNKKLAGELRQIIGDKLDQELAARGRPDLSKLFRYSNAEYEKYQKTSEPFRKNVRPKEGPVKVGQRVLGASEESFGSTGENQIIDAMKTRLPSVSKRIPEMQDQVAKKRLEIGLERGSVTIDNIGDAVGRLKATPETSARVKAIVDTALSDETLQALKGRAAMSKPEANPEAVKAFQTYMQNLTPEEQTLLQRRVFAPLVQKHIKGGEMDHLNFKKALRDTFGTESGLTPEVDRLVKNLDERVISAAEQQNVGVLKNLLGSKSPDEFIGKLSQDFVPVQNAMRQGESIMGKAGQPAGGLKENLKAAVNAALVDVDANGVMDTRKFSERWKNLKFEVKQELYSDDIIKQADAMAAVFDRIENFERRMPGSPAMPQSEARISQSVAEFIAADVKRIAMLGSGVAGGVFGSMISPAIGVTVPVAAYGLYRVPAVMADLLLNGTKGKEAFGLISKGMRMGIMPATTAMRRPNQDESDER